MRRLAQGIVGALALAFMLMYVPWDLEECTAFSCHTTDRWDFDGYFLILMVVMQSLVYAVITTVVLVGVLGMRDSGASSEDAVLAALGQSRRSAIRDAAKRGAVDAAVAIGAGFVISGGFHVWKVFDSHSAFGAAAGAWIQRLTVAAVFAGALVIAHVIDAARPRKSPVDLLHADAAAPGPRRFTLRARMLVFGGLAGAAAGVIVGVTLAHDPADGEVGETTRTVIQGAQITVWLALLALAFAVGVPLVVAGLRPALTRAAGLGATLRAPRAASILEARASTASGASTRTILAISGLALIAGSFAHVSPAPALTPSYLGTISVRPISAGEEFASQYREIDGVGAVVAAPMMSGDDAVIRVDLDEIAAVDPVLTALLTSHPGAMATSNSGYGASIFRLAEAGINATGILPISTCCVGFIDGTRVHATPTDTALLIYAADGADPAEVAQRVANFSPTTTAATSSGQWMAYATENYSGSWIEWVYYGLVALVCLGPVIALAVGVAARRRRDDATLAALGASWRTLRGAAIAETGVVAALAVGFGLLAGAVLQSTMAVIARAEDTFDGVITDSYLQVAVRSVDWGSLAWMFAIAVASFAAAAFVVGLRTRGALPAEQLRAAEEGVLS